MKYRVQEGPKTSAPISPQKVLSLFKKGFVSENALVIDPKGKTITVGEFVRRLDEQIASSLSAVDSAELPAIPGSPDDTDHTQTELAGTSLGAHTSVDADASLDPDGSLDADDSLGTPADSTADDSEWVELEAIDSPPVAPTPPATALPPPAPVVDVFPDARKNVYEPATPDVAAPAVAAPDSPAAPATAIPAVGVAPRQVGGPQPERPTGDHTVGRPPTVRRSRRGRRMSPPATRCAFPGSLLGGLTDFIERQSTSGPIGPRIAMNGLIEGILYCVSFAAIAVVTLHQSVGSGQQSGGDSILTVLLTLAVLAALLVALHFLNTRLIQCQPRFFQLEYRVVDKVFMQAFLIAQTFVIVGIGLFLAITVYRTMNPGSVLQQQTSGISGTVTRLIYVVALIGVFYRGSSLESLGLRQDDAATPTETFLACLMAGLRMPMTMSGWLHLLGVGCLTLNACYMLYLAFAKTAFSAWALSLLPLAILGLIWPLLTTVLAMVGGTIVEILRAILSIERSVIATYGQPVATSDVHDAEDESPFDGPFHDSR